MSIHVDLTTRERLDRMLARAESNLADNLMPFWANHTWDDEYGGFLTRLDRCGRRLDDREKVLMMQVRMIHSLSAAHRHGLADRGYLELAGKGFDYLVETMWDSAEGGFYFSVTRDGKPLSRRKNTDFHGYALTGLSEYYLASGRPEAREWAERVFEVLMDRATDRDLGFIEDFDDGPWEALNAGQMHLGARTKIKTIDMHTNMLEGLAYLSKATQADRHRKVLAQTLELICAKGLHPEHGCTITAFDYDWNPVPDMDGRMTTSYGLNVELAWLIVEAADIMGAPRQRYLPAALRLVDHALEFGFDHEKGGLGAYGPLIGATSQAVDLEPDRLLRSWWAQAEMLNALTCVYSCTRDPKYLKALFSLFDWIDRFQIDHECGDWYQDVYWESGQPVTTDKGGEFKTSFHAGRALIRTAEALRSWI